jgi:hypothetical protein
MHRPIMITSRQFYNVIQDQIGLYAYVNGDMELHKMLEHPIPTHCLTRIAAAQFWIPIQGVTHHDRHLDIPDSNLDGITTIYITDLSSWIMFIQSNVEQSKAYAWKIFPRVYANEIHIRPMNSVLKSEGWNIAPHNAIKSYVRTYADVCLRETQDYLAQHPVTIGIHPSTLNTHQVVTRRTSSCTAQLPPRDPTLDKMEEAIMKSFSTWPVAIQTHNSK